MGYDISLYELCKDVRFLEDLIREENYLLGYAIALCTVDKAYTRPLNNIYRCQNPRRIEFYKKFREQHCIFGEIYRNDSDVLHFEKEYQLDWIDFADGIKACIIKVSG